MTTGFKEFDATIQKTNKVLKEIEESLGWEGRRNQSYGALRAVLHTLRDLLLPEETVQLGAQLPTLIRGVYYEGWDPSKTPRKANIEDFFGEIRRQFPFSMDESVESLVGVVLSALRKHISAGEADDITSEMPRDIKNLISRFIGSKKNPI